MTLAIAIFSMALNHTISFSTYFYDKKIRYKTNHYHVIIIITSIFIII
jgi:hypothetical protein